MQGENPIVTHISSELAALDLEISNCFRCQSLVAGFQKPHPLNRGSKAKIMIIGQNPGRTELTSGTAFSGQSGRKLNDWLIRGGAKVENPRKGIYCTSIVKCFAPDAKSIAAMTHNCRPFLLRQARLVHPSLIITLGQKAYEELRLSTIPYNKALCKVIQTSEEVLLTDIGFHFELLAWPHPSGLNRWHNKPENKSLIEATFSIVEKYIK